MQVDDLREGDLISDSEMKFTKFTRLPKLGRGWDNWPSSGRKLGPVVMPTFVFAGTVRAFVAQPFQFPSAILVHSIIIVTRLSDTQDKTISL